MDLTRRDNEKEAMHYNAWAMLLEGDARWLAALGAKQNFFDWWRQNENAFRFLIKIGMKTERADYLRKKFLNIDVDNGYAKLEKSGARLILRNFNEYPRLLKEISVFPWGLFIQGSLERLEDCLYFAVVGTRKATNYGQEAVKRLIGGLVDYLPREKVIIISGLAFGIDAQAHRAAMENGFKTWAVIPSGLDEVYPASHKNLAEEIVKNGGAIISENPLGTPAEPFRFLQRNRIISGLSRGVLVVEAPLKSGAMITARYALEQNREVMAVPGNIFGKNSEGVNSLIRQGAALVVSSRDILENLGITVSLKEVSEIRAGDLSEGQKRVFEYVSQNSSASLDEIIQSCAFKASEASTLLIELELKGLIKNSGGQYFIKN